MRKSIICLLCALLLMPCSGALAAGVTLHTFTPFADADFAAQAYMDAVTQWESASGNVVEDYSGLTDGNWLTGLQAQIQRGEADLIIVPVGTGLTSQMVVSAQEIADAAPELGARVFPSMAEADGSILLLPVRLNWEALYVNRDVLSQAGLTVPATFDELLAACKTLSAQGITPIANALGDFAEITLDCAALMGAPADVYGTEESKTGAQNALQALKEAGAFGTALTTDAQAESLFIAGNAAMRFDTDGLAFRIPDEHSEQVIVVNVPGMDGEQRTAVAGTPSFGLTFSRACWNDPDRRAAALSLAQALLHGDGAASLVTVAKGALGESILALTAGATDCTGTLYDANPQGFDAWAQTVVSR